MVIFIAFLETQTIGLAMAALKIQKKMIFWETLRAER
jgi:hypothetical protein